MYCPDSRPKYDAGEQFVVFPAPPSTRAGAVGTSAALGASGQLLPAGSQVVLKSVLTGKWCQVVAVGSKQQIICNVAAARGASVMLLTASGFSYQGQKFANPGASQPLYLSGAGSAGWFAPGEYRPCSRPCSRLQLLRFCLHQPLAVER